MSLTQFRTRAQQVTLVLTDCDGVLTDNTVYYSANGEEMKRFSIRDGMGVERLRNAGIQTGIITGENSLSLKSRAAKLKLRYLFQAVNDKRGHLGGISYQTGAEINQMAYIGDDVNDLEIIKAINEGGLTAAPHDAMPEILKVVHYRCSAAGGQGAFREFAEWLLELRNGAYQEDVCQTLSKSVEERLGMDNRFLSLQRSESTITDPSRLPRG
ncbi:MAG TPA: HAD-IIIA family hydrolase [Blastocatellia bacterium]|nr:HAD-IIIA family hydrolase [Blastocatellia bacterium]